MRHPNGTPVCWRHLERTGCHVYEAKPCYVLYLKIIFESTASYTFLNGRHSVPDRDGTVDDANGLPNSGESGTLMLPVLNSRHQWHTTGGIMAFQPHTATTTRLTSGGESPVVSRKQIIDPNFTTNHFRKSSTICRKLWLFAGRYWLPREPVLLACISTFSIQIKINTHPKITWRKYSPKSSRN
jgi:hypothetical protein